MMTDLATENKIVVALADLHRRINGIDIQIRRPSHSSIELLVKEHAQIRIKMDASPNHGRPHLHIDVGQLRYLASYAIDDGERLAGPGSQYEDAAQAWIATHRALLMRVHKVLRAAGSDQQ